MQTGAFKDLFLTARDVALFGTSGVDVYIIDRLE